VELEKTEIFYKQNFDVRKARDTVIVKEERKGREGRDPLKQKKQWEKREKPASPCYEGRAGTKKRKRERIEKFCLVHYFSRRKQSKGTTAYSPRRASDRSERGEGGRRETWNGKLCQRRKGAFSRDQEGGSPFRTLKKKKATLERNAVGKFAPDRKGGGLNDGQNRSSTKNRALRMWESAAFGPMCKGTGGEEAGSSKPEGESISP